MLLYTNLLFSQVPSKIVDALHVEGNEFYYLYHLSDSGNYYADQRKIVRNSFPEDAIKLGWDDGYYITDLSYGNGYWSLIMTKKTSSQNGQRWSTISDTEKIVFYVCTQTMPNLKNVLQKVVEIDGGGHSHSNSTTSKSAPHGIYSFFGPPQLPHLQKIFTFNG